MEPILKPGRNCQGIYEVKKRGLLIDGRDYYRSFYHCAQKARHYILITGWQFDSKVSLLRGKDLEGTQNDVHLLPFLNHLCDRNPDLQIYILAWDFSVLFALKREWLQKWVFEWNANKHIHFRFDSRHAIGASHHQKFVVVDGILAFVGGMDICANRWDVRRHLPKNPDRINAAGKSYELYHDIQTYHEGPVAQKLADLFKIRWAHSEGGTLKLPESVKNYSLAINMSEEIAAHQVALSRTQARTLVPEWESIREIRSLYLDAIYHAEELIYIENQYVSSQAVYNALKNRMTDPHRSRLQIIMILPKKPHALIEEVALGIAQIKMLRSLSRTASQNGHKFRTYYPVSTDEEGEEYPTYIHAKLLLVDDRFMSTGSANISNRSMGLDTELNVAWEAASPDQYDLIKSLRRVRTSLLAEHTGIKEEEGEYKKLSGREGLVDFLDDLAVHSRYRLRQRTEMAFFEENKWFRGLKPEDLAIDPEKPIVEEDLFEKLSAQQAGLFSKGITLLHEWLNTSENSRHPFLTFSNVFRTISFFMILIVLFFLIFFMFRC